jgi:hypothetical protein
VISEPYTREVLSHNICDCNLSKLNKKRSTRKVPIEIGSKPGRALVIPWLLEASRNVRVIRNWFV